MLILQRQHGEIIHIGDDIEIVVIKILSNKSVKLGIKAPDSLKVFRNEIYQKINNDVALLNKE